MSSEGLEHGTKLECGAVIVHGEGAKIKRPFEDMPLEMHELSAGVLGEESTTCPFFGQLGFIEFTSEMRLPRHVHIGPNGSDEQRLLAERILVLAGFAMVELCSELYVVPPNSMVHIPPGVPHTWTACPHGVDINAALDLVTQKPLLTEGKFLMVYEYEAPTSFCPTKQTTVLESVDEYEAASEEELDALKIPALQSGEVNERCWFVWNGDVKQHSRETQEKSFLS
jgi:hypothetical protein